MPTPVVRNSGDREQVKRAERQQRDQVRRQREVAAAVLATPAGREFCSYLLDNVYGVFRGVFSTNALELAYNAGRQETGQRIQALLLDADEAGYDRLVREARERQRQAEQTNQAAEHVNQTKAREAADDGD